MPGLCALERSGVARCLRVGLVMLAAVVPMSGCPRSPSQRAAADFRVWPWLDPLPERAWVILSTAVSEGPGLVQYRAAGGTLWPLSPTEAVWKAPAQDGAYAVRSFVTDASGGTVDHEWTFHVSGSGEAMLARSDDGGVSWTDLSGWIPAGAAVHPLAVGADGAVYLGLAWGAVPVLDLCGANPPGALPHPLPLASCTPSSWLGNALFRSDDGGTQWIWLRGGLPDDLEMVALAAAPADATLAAVSSYGLGVWMTRTRGLAWWSYPPGPSTSPRDPSFELAFGSSDASLTASGFGSLARLDLDAATAWRQMPETQPELRALAPLGGDPTQQGVWLAGTVETGLVRSSDGARSFSPCSGPPTGGGAGPVSVEALAWSPSPPGRAWASVATGGDEGLLRAFAVAPSAPLPGNVWATQDGGSSWTPSSLGQAPLALAEAAPGVLIALTADGTGVRSTDGGATWTSSPLPLSGYWELAADPSRPGRIYAAGRRR